MGMRMIDGRQDAKQKGDFLPFHFVQVCVEIKCDEGGRKVGVSRCVLCSAHLSQRPPSLNNMKQHVLFVGLQNAARSQMAKALLNYFYGDAFEAHSAGLEPQKLNLLAVEVMRQQGIDISRNKTKWVYDFIKDGDLFDYVITVCDEQNAKRCPEFPGAPHRLDWSFPDPSKFHGSQREQIARTRELRDAIKTKIDDWYGSALNRPLQK